MPVYKSLQEIFSVLKNEQNSRLPEIEELINIYESKKQCTNVENSENPLIVFEGLDGSGKSTIIKIINERIEGTVFTTPPECIKHLRSHFDNTPEFRSAFYSLGNYIAAEGIKEKLNESTVLVDRFWHSTCAYNLATDAGSVPKLPPKESEIYKWPDDLLKPDAVVYLSVPEHQRIERLSRRATYTAEEDRLKNDEDFRKACLTALQRVRNPTVIKVPSIQSPKKTAEFALNTFLQMGLKIKRKSF